MRRLCLTLGALTCAINPVHAQPAAPRARLVQDLRLDANAEDFSAVNRVLVGPRGEIVVPLRQDMQIRVYDSTGKPLARIGRRGTGPGEFENLWTITWVGDTLWTHDFETLRYAYFRRDGILLRAGITASATSGVPPTASGEPQALLHFDAHGVLADGSVIGTGQMLAGPRGRGEQMSPPALITISPAGVARILGPLPNPMDARYTMRVGGLGNTVPFMIRPSASPSFDGMRYATLESSLRTRDSGAFVVTVIRVKGDTAFSRAYPFRGVPIPQRVRDSAIAALGPNPARPAGTHGESSPEIARQFQALARERMPAVYTPSESITLGNDSTVWIGMRPTAEGQETLMLNHRGDPIATVFLPRGTRFAQGSATHVWAMQSDADGLVSVVRFRVQLANPRPPGGR